MRTVTCTTNHNNANASQRHLPALTDRDQVDSGCIDDQHMRAPGDESSDDDISFGILEESSVYAIQFTSNNGEMISSDDSSSSGFEASEALNIDDDNGAARVRPRKAPARARKVTTIRARPATSRTTRASSRNK